ncbi:MAG: hypothetical protein AAF311_02265 [Pseudomonadota bacterium]
MTPARLKLIVLDGDCALIQVLSSVKCSLFDYTEIHCTLRVDGDFELTMEVETAQLHGEVNALLDALRSLQSVRSAEAVGGRRHPERL